jgi:putative N6-adenine-specific DNA methylase
MSPSSSPQSDPALEKRVKRQVIGRTREFFAVTAPGLEPLCLKELSELDLTSQTGRAVTGGVAFSGRLQDAYLANLRLRTATRILMRIGAVHATRFDQLEKGVNEIPWELYLPPSAPVTLRAAASRCRLYHKEAIAERVRRCIAERFSARGFGSNSLRTGDISQTVFVRGTSDRFLFSLDSSGDPLYKRSIKTDVGRAPLRETLAAASLMWAGYTGDNPLIDPLCGSGAFSLEAALIGARIPPGHFRDFAFMGWPAFRSTRWTHIKSEARKEIRRSPIQPIFASDRDQNLCRALEKATLKHGLEEWITVTRRDFFDFSPRDLTRRTGWVTLNPPYGRRLGSPEEKNRLLAVIIDRLHREYRGWTMVLLVPGRNPARFLKFPVTTRTLFHGGLTLNLLIGTIP